MASLSDVSERAPPIVSDFSVAGEEAGAIHEKSSGIDQLQTSSSLASTFLSNINAISMESESVISTTEAPRGQEQQPQHQQQQQTRRVVVRRRRRDQQKEAPAVDPMLLNSVLEASHLPKAYNFEISKTVERIHQLQAKHVALQMPEGLLMYATVLSDVFKRLAPFLVHVTILGDVTYGACCIDDLGATAMGAELLVHYGHSCLVPMAHTVLPCLYVFVEIQIDVLHLVECLDATLTTTTWTTKPHVFLLGTIQFRHALTEANQMLQARGYSITIPQAKPLSPGEVLGCTSPKLILPNSSDTMENATVATSNSNAVVCFVADGRFHLEATMISNPHIGTFYRYDPYGKQLTIETYGHEAMASLRQAAIRHAKNAKTFGVILGTLGRQGNPALVQSIRSVLTKHNKTSFLILLSEITPAKLKLMPAADAWVQVACPRLSVDWGHYFDKPLLTPYELLTCLGETDWQDVYPMDFYSNEGGLWANYHANNKDRKVES